jgi:DNA-binding NarL/FixJ family response regulator
MKRLRVLLAGDPSLIQEGLRSLLSPYCDSVETVDNGRAAVETALRLRPDLSILDIAMPVLNGLEAAREIRGRWPDARLLFLIGHSNPIYIREAMRAGAVGYILKASPVSQITPMLQRVLRGEVGVTPQPATMQPDHSVPAPEPGGEAGVELTARQAEVLRLIAEGGTNRQIAALLKLSVKTVEFHRGEIRRKLGLRTTANLTRYALRAGLVAS